MPENQSKFPIKYFQVSGCIAFIKLAKLNNFSFKHLTILTILCSKYLWFVNLFEVSCEIAHHKKSLIFLFQKIFTSTHKNLFLEKGWALGSNSMKFWDFFWYIRLGFLKVVFSGAGVKLTPQSPSYFKKNKSKINITWYNC